jgi:hypothetical protein
MTKVNSTEDKVLRAMHGLFILQAAQIGMTGAEMRKILGIGMNEVTPTFKAVNRLLKKKHDKASVVGR